MDAIKTLYWAYYTDGFRIGDDFTQSFSLASFPTIFDSGTSLIYLPASMGNILAERALSGIYYEYY